LVKAFAGPSHVHLIYAGRPGFGSLEQTSSTLASIPSPTTY